MAEDLINQPPHYKSASGLEAIEVIEAFELGYHLGNAVKYILRASHKGNVEEDIKKACWYLNRWLKIGHPKTMTDNELYESIMHATSKTR